MLSQVGSTVARPMCQPGRKSDGRAAAPASCLSAPRHCLRLWRRACPAAASAVPPLRPASGPVRAAPVPTRPLWGWMSRGARSGPPGPRTLALRPRSMPPPALQSQTVKQEQKAVVSKIHIGVKGAHRQDGAGRERAHHGLQLCEAAVQRVGHLQGVLAQERPPWRGQLLVPRSQSWMQESRTWTSSSRAPSRSAAARQPP